MASGRYDQPVCGVGVEGSRQLHAVNGDVWNYRQKPDSRLTEGSFQPRGNLAANRKRPLSSNKAISQGVIAETPSSFWWDA